MNARRAFRCTALFVLAAALQPFAPFAPTSAVVIAQTRTPITRTPWGEPDLQGTYNHHLRGQHAFWTFSLPLTADAHPVPSYECHEGNYGLRNILSAAPAEEREGR